MWVCESGKILKGLKNPWKHSHYWYLIDSVTHPKLKVGFNLVFHLPYNLKKKPNLYLTGKRAGEGNNGTFLESGRCLQQTVLHQHLELCQGSRVAYPHELPLHHGMYNHWSSIRGSSSDGKCLDGHTWSCSVFIVLPELRIISSLPIKSVVTLMILYSSC